MRTRSRCFDPYYLLVLCTILITGTDGQQPSSTPFPSQFWGDWYSIDNGVELHTLINAQQMKNEKIADSECVGVYVFNDTIDDHGNYDARILIFDKVTQCYQCFEMYHRTVNILQYKQSTCITPQQGNNRFDLDYICSNITSTTDILTMFRITLQTVDCKKTLEGNFRFTYEVNYGGGGTCDSPGSTVVACFDPESVYVDNQIFYMYFGKCLNVTSSFNQSIRFQCMGTWTDPNGNIYSAMTDIASERYMERFRCMLTRNDQQYADNSRYYALSRWAECSSLKSPSDGPIRLKMRPVSGCGAEGLTEGSELTTSASAMVHTSLQANITNVTSMPAASTASRNAWWTLGTYFMLIFYIVSI